MAVTTDDAMAVPALPDPFGAASVAVSALQELDLDGLSPEELNEAVAAFQQLRARVDAAEARLVARWDAVTAWRLDGAKTPAAWIAWRTRLPVEEARRRVRHARAVRDLPTLAEAWAAGDIDRAHVTTPAPHDGGRPAPLFTVVVGYDTFAGPTLELFNRTVITPGTAARWLTDAYVERVVFDSPSRVIDVGAQRRFFRGALRRAIEVRDRTCFHPTCDDVPQRTEIDHITPASHGGSTTQINGRQGCAFHNLDRDPDTDPDPPSW